MDMNTNALETPKTEAELLEEAKLLKKLPVNPPPMIVHSNGKATIIPPTPVREAEHKGPLIADNLWRFEESLLALSRKDDNVRHAQRALIEAIRDGHNETVALEVKLAKALQDARIEGVRPINEDRALHMAQAVTIHEQLMQKARDAHEAGYAHGERMRRRGGPFNDEFYL